MSHLGGYRQAGNQHHSHDKHVSFDRRHDCSAAHDLRKGVFLMGLWRALRRYSDIPYFIRKVGHPRHLGSLLATSWPCSEVHN